MDVNAVFRENLRAAMAETGVKPATLSKRAGLNARAVTDILEGRSESPKLSTVFALAYELGKDPGELMGLGRRPRLSAGLADYLSRYDEFEQEQLLAALLSLPARPA